MEITYLSLFPFLSLSRLLSPSLSPFVTETEVFTFEAAAPTPHTCALQLHLSSVLREPLVAAAFRAVYLLYVFTIN